MDVDESKPEEQNNDVEMKEPEQQSSTTEEEPKPAKEDDKSESDDLTIDIDPKTYCKLGHFHLLLGDFAKGVCMWMIIYHVNTTCVALKEMESEF
jgi:hypothetical protein